MLEQRNVGNDTRIRDIDSRHLEAAFLQLHNPVCRLIQTGRYLNKSPVVLRHDGISMSMAIEVNPCTLFLTSGHPISAHPDEVSLLYDPSLWWCYERDDGRK